MRLREVVPDGRREAILRAWSGRAAPADPCGRAIYVAALSAKRSSPHWPLIVSVWRTLPRASRRRIIRRRRSVRGLIPDPREIFRVPPP